jgi:hypothetical protein
MSFNPLLLKFDKIYRADKNAYQNLDENKFKVIADLCQNVQSHLKI